MTDREAIKLALDALEYWQKLCLDNGRASHELGRSTNAIAALRQAIQEAEKQEQWTPDDMAHRPCGLSMGQDEIVPSYYSGVTGDYSGVTGDYMEPPSWTPVEIGVDVTPEGTHVVGMYVLMPQAVRHVFYSQFHPAPKREWVGLTDEEIMGMYNHPRSDAEMIEFARAIDAKLKEKNSG